MMSMTGGRVACGVGLALVYERAVDDCPVGSDPGTEQDATASTSISAVTRKRAEPLRQDSRPRQRIAPPADVPNAPKPPFRRNVSPAARARTRVEAARCTRGLRLPSGRCQHPADW